MKRVLCIAGIAGLLGACSKAEPGPPTQLKLSTLWASEDGGGTISGRVLDAESRPVPVDGTLHYTVYEGHPRDGKKRCSTTAAVQAAEFERLGDEGVGFQVNVRFPTDCTPLPDGVLTYGLIALELSDGTRVANDETSWVPKTLGGIGDMNFPKHHERDMKRLSPDDPANQRAAFFERLASLATLDPGGAPPVGQPCSPAPKPGRVIRISMPMLKWLGANREKVGRAGAWPVSRDGFFAMNGYETLPVAEFLTAATPPNREALDKVLAEPFTHAEVVVPSRFEEPTLTDAGAADRAGSYRPGVLQGEVWVVNLDQPKIACRASLAATNLEDARGDQFDTSIGKAVQQFAGSAANAVNAAVAQVAPGLRAQAPG